MTRRREECLARGRNVAARWLLVFAVLVGVTAMHVLGHPHAGHTAGRTARHAARPAAGPAAVTAVAVAAGHPGPTAVAEHTATDPCRSQTVVPDGCLRLDPTSVCLAILTGSLPLLVPLLGRLTRDGLLALAASLASRVRSAGLAPTRALSLPELSVLRL